MLLASQRSSKCLFYILIWPDRVSNLRFTTYEEGTLTITPLVRFSFVKKRLVKFITINTFNTYRDKLCILLSEWICVVFVCLSCKWGVCPLSCWLCVSTTLPIGCWLCVSTTLPIGCWLCVSTTLPIGCWALWLFMQFWRRINIQIPSKIL
jgi:hypothetical protein